MALTDELDLFAASCDAHERAWVADRRDRFGSRSFLRTQAKYG
jgi:hypothetical protein